MYCLKQPNIIILAASIIIGSPLNAIALQNSSSKIDSAAQTPSQSTNVINIAQNNTEPEQNLEYCSIPETSTNLEPKILKIPLETGNNSEIANIRILGNSLFTSTEIQEIIESVQSSNQNLEVFIQNFIDAINQTYQQKGYITSKAKLVGLNNRTLEIQLI